MDLFPFVESLLHSLVFVWLVSCINEPYRRQLMVIMLAYAGGAYLNNNFQLHVGWFGILMCCCAFLGFRNYLFLGIGWLFHSAYDWIHYLAGFPLINGVPGTAFGCAVFDIGLAVYFIFGAPDLFKYTKSFFFQTKHT